MSMSEIRCYICGKTAEEANETLKEVANLDEWNQDGAGSTGLKVSINYVDFKSKIVTDRKRGGPPYSKMVLAAKIPVCTVCEGVMDCKAENLRYKVQFM